MTAAREVEPFRIQAEPGRLLAAVNRLPSLMFRLRLGRLFGERLAEIVHRGRKTGLPRTVIVELCDGSVASGRLVYVAAYGGNAQWIKNLRASAPVSIQVGGATFDSPRCEFLDPDATRQAVAAYWRRYPKVAAFLAKRKLYPYPGQPLADDPGAPVGLVIHL
jgi:deazaflavin-dependent oxidoreductase (nitroreductase family)